MDVLGTYLTTRLRYLSVILCYFGQRIHAGMDEMYEMDRKLYTQLAQALIGFFFFLR